MSPATPTVVAFGDATAAQCDKAARLLQSRTGIILGDHKVGATQRILSTLSSRYADGDAGKFLYLLEENGEHAAWTEFINAFTVNHTAFFREPHHFVRLEEFFRSRPTGCSVWCAASSTGEEPYSIAMVAEEVYGATRAQCSILATDIDTRVLEFAQKGIYPSTRIGDVGDVRLKRHFLRGVESQQGKVRIRPNVQSRVTFAPFNLNDRVWSVSGPFDAVFCRNTMIYFDRPTQQRLLEKFARVMRPGSLLFVGHSENISQLTNDFHLLGQTVYQRK
ncbi:CheR family methyltransferase [Bordetella sp. 15P40C-2]|uniref:CheR family methyltransferase n=1 Tax=Bordetella sp. 15P40C-2 TaxID=2572246 RepID=UPI0013227999|nr:CheR family methyltransferase [Bordetella sp. 15P40C-2]MVW70022.1 chemotaxis protein CheR [Bordetella sp. 15P40C-2]